MSIPRITNCNGRSDLQKIIVTSFTSFQNIMLEPFEYFKQLSVIFK